LYKRVLYLRGFPPYHQLVSPLVCIGIGIGLRTWQHFHLTCSAARPILFDGLAAQVEVQVERPGLNSQLVNESRRIGAVMDEALRPFFLQRDLHVGAL